jgi:hypothetical protein
MRGYSPGGQVLFASFPVDVEANGWLILSNRSFIFGSNKTRNISHFLVLFLSRQSVCFCCHFFSIALFLAALWWADAELLSALRSLNSGLHPSPPWFCCLICALLARDLFLRSGFFCKCMHQPWFSCIFGSGEKWNEPLQISNTDHCSLCMAGSAMSMALGAAGVHNLQHLHRLVSASVAQISTHTSAY